MLTKDSINRCMVIVHGIAGSVAFASLACDSSTGATGAAGQDMTNMTPPGNAPPPLTPTERAGNASNGAEGAGATPDGAGDPPSSSGETSGDLPLSGGSQDTPSSGNGGEGAPATGDGEDTSGTDETGEGTPTDEVPAPGMAIPVTPACPASATASPGETNRSVTVGGMNRTYLLHVPPGYDGSTPVPVVIDFHPLGGTGNGQRNLSGWGDLADQEGFIAVFPNGVDNSWNVGRCCPPAADQQVDDVAFARAIIAQLQTEACVDAKRIYASGCSNGGGMSYKVACEAADVIAAVAPVDFDCVVGPNNVPSCGGCNPARPISEIQFRATGDFAVNYEGGPAPIPQGMDFPGAEQNLSDWGEINSCTGAPAPLDDHPACEAFPTCADGAQTMLCTRQGGGHCNNYAALDIVNVAWEMFQNTSLP
jgi:polyhydroxybutyrate depolymerase